MSEKIIRIANLYWLILLTAVILFLSFQTAFTVFFDLPTFIDELIQAFMLVCLLFMSPRSLLCRKIIYLYVFVFILLLVFSYPALAHRGLSNVLQQIFVHLKFLIYISFLVIFVEPKFARFIIAISMSLSMLFLGIDIVIPGYLNEIFEQAIQVRGGVIRPIGIQGHTGTLGFFMAIASVYYVSRNKAFHIVFKYSVFLLMAILVLLTTVRTALVVFPLIILWWFKDSFKKSIVLISILIVFVLGIGSNRYIDEMLYITEQNIEMTIEDPSKGSYIRGIMLYFSFELASDRFPLGTGAATFGTVKSDDSAIYAEIGMQNSRFFIDKDGIYDSNFASVLGEFGYIGMFLYYTLFVYICRLLRRYKGRAVSSEFFFVIIMLMIIYSFTNPVFMNTYQIFIFSFFYVAAHFSDADNSETEDAILLKESLNERL